MEQKNTSSGRLTTKSGKTVRLTDEDLLNNPGVEIDTIAEVKSQYHFHRISSATLNHHTLTCTFAIDTDPSSIFYTLPENDAEPVREYEVEGKGDIEITPDRLSVKIGEQLISAEEIWGD